MAPTVCRTAPSCGCEPPRTSSAKLRPTQRHCADAAVVDVVGAVQTAAAVDQTAVDATVVVSPRVRRAPVRAHRPVSAQAPEPHPKCPATLAVAVSGAAGAAVTAKAIPKARDKGAVEAIGEEEVSSSSESV